MSEPSDLVSQQPVQQDLIESSLNELLQLIDQYPYFAPARFILVKKLKEERSAEYRQQLQKALLYTHDPVTLDQYLNSEKYHTAFTWELPVLSEQPPKKEQSRSDGADLTSIKPDALQEATPKADVLFEPYHTVDYFASQGIRLAQEEAAKDQLGKQLKSFTEWLKTMKRIPAAEQIRKLDTQSEQKVENMAAHSVEGSDIVTETMAEVWIKQGNKEKAIEVYNKLSLFNPPKRAYFAAKIEQLKKEH